MKKRAKLNPKLTAQTVYMGWAWFAFELLFLPGLLLAWLGKLNFSDAAVNFVYYLVNFFACLTIFRDFLSEQVKRAAKNMLPFLRAIALGFGLYYGGNFLMERLLALAAPGFSNVNDQNIAAMFARSPWLMGLGTVLLVPLAEECLFRGLVFSQLYAKDKPLAYAITAAAFAAIHVAGYLGQYSPLVLGLCFAQYLIPSLVLCWTYAHSGTILAPIFLHTAINVMATLELV